MDTGEPEEEGEVILPASEQTSAPAVRGGSFGFRGGRGFIRGRGRGRGVPFRGGRGYPIRGGAVGSFGRNARSRSPDRERTTVPTADTAEADTPTVPDTTAGAATTSAKRERSRSPPGHGSRNLTQSVAVGSEAARKRSKSPAKAKGDIASQREQRTRSPPAAKVGTTQPSTTSVRNSPFPPSTSTSTQTSRARSPPPPGPTSSPRDRNRSPPSVRSNAYPVTASGSSYGFSSARGRGSTGYVRGARGGPFGTSTRTRSADRAVTSRSSFDDTAPQSSARRVSGSDETRTKPDERPYESTRTKDEHDASRSYPEDSRKARYEGTRPEIPPRDEHPSETSRVPVRTRVGDTSFDDSRKFSYDSSRTRDENSQGYSAGRAYDYGVDKHREDRTPLERDSGYATSGRSFHDREERNGPKPSQDSDRYRRNQDDVPYDRYTRESSEPFGRGSGVRDFSRTRDDYEDRDRRYPASSYQKETTHGDSGLPNSRDSREKGGIETEAKSKYGDRFDTGAYDRDNRKSGERTGESASHYKDSQSRFDEPRKSPSQDYNVTGGFQRRYEPSSTSFQSRSSYSRDDETGEKFRRENAVTSGDTKPYYRSGGGSGVQSSDWEYSRSRRYDDDDRREYSSNKNEYSSTTSDQHHHYRGSYERSNEDRAYGDRASRDDITARANTRDSYRTSERSTRDDGSSRERPSSPSFSSSSALYKRGKFSETGEGLQGVDDRGRRDYDDKWRPVARDEGFSQDSYRDRKPDDFGQSGPRRHAGEDSSTGPYRSQRESSVQREEPSRRRARSGASQPPPPPPSQLPPTYTRPARSKSPSNYPSRVGAGYRPYVPRTRSRPASQQVPPPPPPPYPPIAGRSVATSEPRPGEPPSAHKPSSAARGRSRSRPMTMRAPPRFASFRMSQPSSFSAGGSLGRPFVPRTGVGIGALAAGTKSAALEAAKTSNQSSQPGTISATNISGTSIETPPVAHSRFGASQLERELSVVPGLQAINERLLTSTNDNEDLGHYEKLRQELEAMRVAQFKTSLDMVQAEMNRAWARFELRQTDEKLSEIQSSRMNRSSGLF